MTEKQIQCPHCQASISLTEAITSEIREDYRKKYKEAVLKRDGEIALLQKQMELEKQSIEKQKNDLNQIVMERLQSEKLNLEKKIKEDMSNQTRVEVEDLKNQLTEKTKRVEESQQMELELRKKTRELIEKEQNLELELQRKFDAERLKVQEDTAKRLADDMRLKAAEKDKQLDDMRRQIEDLKRKAEQGSQQSQGEILELEVEAILRSMFPIDSIEPVPKGMRGGDIIHRVNTQSGASAGIMIWETKRTKSWSDSWIEKLKDDQRAISAEFSIIITQVMPKDTTNLVYIDGVWVVDFATFRGIAVALRTHLLQLFQARAMAVGKGETRDFLYDYLIGVQFKQRIEAIVESFQTMQMDLDREKRAIQKSWAAREQQITKILTSTVGMYGDMQGIIGNSLPKIQQLELSDSDEVLALDG
jgi:hypothetical protein